MRLIPGSETDAERASLKELFNYRLSSDPTQARLQWLDIVEGRAELWTNISSEKRELIRSVFNLVNLEIVKRARPSSVFNFSKASIGNLFLTGYVCICFLIRIVPIIYNIIYACVCYLTNTSSRGRVFTGSLESAIYLLSTICSIAPTVSALPAINSNFTHHISAGLADGTYITGQNSISHPSAPTSLPDDEQLPQQQHLRREMDEHDRIEDATLPGSLPTLRKQYINFSKADEEDLPARIERIWYINPYGHEIWPLANPKVLDAVRRAGAVIYSIGSLYTSIVPSLVLRGVGAVLADPGVRYKVLILNSSVDRETGPSTEPLTATGFVRAIARAAAQSRGDFVVGDEKSMGKGEVSRYVTHLVYLEGEGVPKVNKEELAALGIGCIRVYGRRVDGMLKYDEAGLARTLEAVIGKPEMARSRRNTNGQ